jgi:hypothetical protein
VIDAILLGCFIAALYFDRSVYPATLCYALCVLYSVTLFDSHSAVLNHVIYGLIFIPACYFAKLKTSAMMLIYSSFHLAVAVDYLLYPEAVTILSYYYNYIQVLLALSIILISFKVRYNDNTIHYRCGRNSGFRLVNICNIQIYSEKKD